MTVEPLNAMTTAPVGNGKPRVGIAVQGGVIPAGAFAAGVLKGLVDAGAFEKREICAFSGTSAGAAIAAVCWGHTLMETPDKIGEDLEKQWTFLAWPQHLDWIPTWSPAINRAMTEFDALAMKFPLWRLFVAGIRTPIMRWIMTRWYNAVIPFEELNAAFRSRFPNYGENGGPAFDWSKGPGLVMGAADVLRGELKTFREGELSLSALLASGSLESMSGRTTISSPPQHAGTYLDGAWADNPPMNELLDYSLDELWVIQCFPKGAPKLPETPTERKERRDELWQNSLVEHEHEFIRFVNDWADQLTEAVLARIRALQETGELPGSGPEDSELQEHLQAVHRAEGALPRKLRRLFDEKRQFKPRIYKQVAVRTIEVTVPREEGSSTVNAPWFIRNLMRVGEEQARDFAERDFGRVPPPPASHRSPTWAVIPAPINDVLFGVEPARPVAEALALVCDFCPRKAAATAGEMIFDALPAAVTAPLVAADRMICAACPRTLMTKLAA